MRRRRVAAAAPVVALLVVCALAPSGLAQAPEPVTLRLNWVANSFDAPFYLALVNGYYRAANLEVTILEGRGSGSTIQLVANGVDTFGFADTGVVAKSVGQGIPVKMVMGVFKRTPLALLAAAGSGIETPQDLKGKRVAVCAADSAFILLPAYLKAVNVGDVKTVVVDCQAKYAVVAQGKADLVAGFGPSGKRLFEALGVKEVRTFGFADAGLVLPAHGVIASLKTIETRAEVVGRFVAATAEGWVQARRNPGAAVEALSRSVPMLKGKEAALRGELEEWLGYLESASTVGRPFGWQAAEDWKQAQAILVQYMDLKPPPSLDAYFTNRFISEQGVR